MYVSVINTGSPSQHFHLNRTSGNRYLLSYCIQKYTVFLFLRIFLMSHETNNPTENENREKMN